MDILTQLAIIFLFGLGGKALEYALGAGFPASVIGLILMLIALRVKVVKTEHIDRTADFLSANMGFFFLPSAVAVMGEYSTVAPVLVPVVVIMVVTLLVTFAVTYAVAALTQKLMKGRS